MSLTTVEAPTRPILRYPGGKWRLAPWILEHMPAHRCYVEPFMGAASCFVRKPRAYAEVLNDLHGDLVTLFRILRDPVQALELEQMLRLTPFSLQEFEAAWAETDEPLERARRVLVRSWQSFNPEAVFTRRSGWRKNVTRRGTLPAHDWGRYPEQIGRFTARLQGVVIEQTDALMLLPQYDSPDTLFFVDPPYDAEVCPGFRGYAHTVDHTALYEALASLRGMVMICGYHSPTYDALYRHWDCRESDTTYGAENGKLRRHTECLWLNDACQRQRAQLPLFA